MICRLCLTETSNCIQIYTKSRPESEIAKVIAKYLYIEVNLDDEISTRVCNPCWKQLGDFDEFCVEIQRKQENLKLQFVESKNDGSLEEHETELKPLEENSDPFIFCQPLLNIVKVEDVNLQEQNFPLLIENENTLTVNNLTKGKRESKRKSGKTDQTKINTSKPSNLRCSLRSFSKTKTKLTETCIKDEILPVNDLIPVEADQEKENVENKVVLSESQSNIQSNSEAIVPSVEVATNTKGLKGLKNKRKVPQSKRGRKRKFKNAVIKKEKNCPSITESCGVVDKFTFKKFIPESIVSKDADAYISENVELSCCLCKQSLTDFSELKKHFRQEHNCVGYVRCCNNRYIKRIEYVEHLQMHKNPDLFKCVECNKTLASRKNYINHMLSIHPPEEDLKFQCELCSKKFAKQYILTYHIKKNHVETKDHTCEMCSKSFRSIYELQSHEKHVHFNQPLICEICGKSFKCKSNLKYHMNAIHGSGHSAEVQCDVCQRWLKDVRGLKKHKQRHIEEQSNKEYTCNICGVVKASRVKLDGHRRYYHSNKIYKCTVCEKQFKSPITLKEHIATHTGKDLYNCLFCTRTFKSHANMHNHKKKMHPNEWVRKYSQPSKPIEEDNVAT